ncbi:hypothetical protein GCM10029963_35790 [Micromonospora andamanensis]
MQGRPGDGPLRDPRSRMPTSRINSMTSAVPPAIISHRRESSGVTDATATLLSAAASSPVAPAIRGVPSGPALASVTPAAGSCPDSPAGWTSTSEQE